MSIHTTQRVHHARTIPVCFQAALWLLNPTNLGQELFCCIWFLLLPRRPQSSAVLPRRAACNQRLSRQSHPPVSIHFQLQHSERGAVSLLPSSQHRRGPIPVGYSGLGGSVLQSPVSDRGLCEKMFIPSDTPSSRLMGWISQ